MPAGVISAGYTGIGSLLYNTDVRPHLIKRYRDSDFLTWLDIMKAWRKKTDSQFYTAYDTPLYQAVDTTGATSIATSGTPIITINALTTGNSNILVKGKLVRWYQAGTLYNARVASVTQASGRDTVVLHSSEAGAPNIVMTAGAVLYPYSNAQEEGSYAPPPERWGIDTIYNLIQIFRKTGEITDVARARNSGGAFKLDLGNGQTGLVSWEDVRTLMAHRGDISNALLLGKMSDANFTSASPSITGERGYGVQTTKGVIPFIEQYGWQNNLASLGTWASTDLEAIIAAITAARGADEYMGFGGKRPIARTSSYLKGMGSSGVTSARLNVNGNTINFDVESMTFGGVTFHFKALNDLDNTQLVASTDVVSKSIFWMPMGNAPTYNGGKSSVAPYVGVAYLPVIQPGAGDEKQALVHIGALLETPNSGTAVKSSTYETMAGADVVQPYIMGRSQVIS